MRNAELKKLALDMRLNSDAVRVVIFVDSMGTGKHEISNDEFRAILHMAGPKKVSLALRLSEKAGWISRTKGGWGSPDSYEYTGCTDPSKTEGTGGDTDPAKMEGTGGDTDPATLVVTGQELTLPKRKAQDTDPAKMEGTTRAREQRKREREVVDRSARAREIDPRVDRELKGEKWDGFRNSIRDYFYDRVDTEKQWGYLMRVATWFDGDPTGPKGFFKLDPKDRKLVVAGAVNELLSMSAEQERKTFKSAMGLQGQPNTLRTKIEYLIRRRDFPSNGTRLDRSTHQGALDLRDPKSLFPEERG